MSTEYALYYIDEKDLYRNQTKEKKAQLEPEIVKMAKERGIKPTARYFYTYASTIRRIIKNMKMSTIISKI